MFHRVVFFLGFYPLFPKGYVGICRGTQGRGGGAGGMRALNKFFFDVFQQLWKANADDLEASAVLDQSMISYNRSLRKQASHFWFGDGVRGLHFGYSAMSGTSNLKKSKIQKKDISPINCISQFQL